jgi:glycosyltransferase involved in cell wall biosynthesis
LTAPVLSVVVPTYNRCDSLRLTLDGLARQSYPADRFEVVVVSDGSTDGTEAMLADYARRTSYTLRPLTQQNAGPSRARNRAIREATGDIVVFIDDDVEPAPAFLATHAGHHVKDEKVVVIGPLSPDLARRAAEPSWIAWEHAMLQKQYDAFRSGEWASAGPNHFYSGNGSVRRRYLLDVGGFDESFTRQEDVEMATRMQRDCGVHFVFDPDALGIHRPLRTFESWLKVPYSYGRLDVIRARLGSGDWGVVRHGYIARNRATRLLIETVLKTPRLSPPLRAGLLRAANAAYRAGQDGAAFAALSALYNARYIEGARAELGDTRLLQALLFQNVLPPPGAAGT